MISTNLRRNKGIIILFSVILVFSILVAGPSIFRSIKLNQLNRQTEAGILTIEEKKVNVQHYSGTSEKLIGYHITFSYMVDDTTYTNSEVLKPGSEIKRLYDLFKSDQDCSIKIRYSQDDPSNSKFFGETEGNK